MLNLQFPSHPGHTHFTDYDTFDQTNHAAQLLWVIVMHWHAQNAGEPLFEFWEILMVLWLRGSQVIYIFMYNFICRYQNELKFWHKAQMIFLHLSKHLLPRQHVYK